ncbi:YqjD family protein [Cognatishimia sp. MH4019]|uniref:DUF883 family protein n=1 Tax=Cognatishimia sp. MH4019 TaxID=2854030 RepID=UPI001CD6964F|nr:hypothetical protein [Cognatishimia sp. MH4019]
MANTSMTNGKAKSPNTGDLAEQINTIKSDIAELTSLMAEMGTAKTEDAKEKVRERVEQARDVGAAQLADAQVKAQKLGAEANDFVTRQPATALGIAAGVGFLIGMLGSRK